MRSSRLVRKEYLVTDSSASRVWMIVLLPLLFLGAGPFAASLATAGLYECRHESGAPIYTDSPAQLDRCQPVASGGNSRLGLVGGPHPSSSHALLATTAEPVPSFPAPAAPAPVTQDSGSAAIAPTGGLVSGSSAEPLCVPGMNPLNPLSGPPCSTTPPAAPPSIMPPPLATP